MLLLLPQNVALVDILPNDKKLKTLQDSFKEQNIILLIADITKRDSIEKLFKELIEKFQRIDIVVCGAGILNEKNPTATINVNVVCISLFTDSIISKLTTECRSKPKELRFQLGVINTTLVAMDYMSKDNDGLGGLIINISSVAGLTSFPGAPSYTASKHAIIGFTRSLSVWNKVTLRLHLGYYIQWIL